MHIPTEIPNENCPLTGLAKNSVNNITMYTIVGSPRLPRSMTSGKSRVLAQ